MEPFKPTAIVFPSPDIAMHGPPPSCELEDGSGGVVFGIKKSAVSTHVDGNTFLLRS